MKLLFIVACILSLNIKLDSFVSVLSTSYLLIETHVYLPLG